MATCYKCHGVLPDDGKLRKKERPRKCTPCKRAHAREKWRDSALFIDGIRERLLRALRRNGHPRAFATREFVERVLARWGRTCVITGQTALTTKLDLVPYRGFDWTNPPPEHEWLVVSSTQTLRLRPRHSTPAKRMSMFPEQVHNRIAELANPQ
jgi:hypothetical protein